MLFGLIILLIASVCQGSFGIGYKSYKPFTWAGFWGVYCICCLIISGTTALILVPTFPSFIREVEVFAYLCGGLWGISAIGFSKGIGRVGLTMVYGISMGISTIVGTITPVLLHEKKNGITSAMIGGMLITIVGIGMFTYAGLKRDINGMEKEKKKSNRIHTEISRKKIDYIGYGMAIFSGLGSGAMNVGFSMSSNLETKLGGDISYLGLSAVKWFPVLVGGLLAGIMWCLFEVTLKKEWGTILIKNRLQSGIRKRSGILFLVAVVWYFALLLYGRSNVILQQYIGQMTWVIFNSLALMVSVVWGIFGGEWKGHKKNLLFISCGVLITSLVLIAFS